MDSRDLIVRIKGDTSGFQNSMNGVSESANKGGMSFSKMAGAVAVGQAIYGAATTAFHMLDDGIKDVMKSAEESENIQAQLQSVLKSTGQAAGLTKDDLNDQAQALQRVTTFTDEQINASQAMLLTFTNIHGAMFQKTTPAILDMATAMHEDLQTASIQVGKALNDPITGLNSLHKIGVTFTDGQKEQIKTMQKAGDVAGAQTIILKELQKEFGGSAVAAGQTFAGSLQRLNNQVDDMKEKVGGAIITAIIPFVTKLATFVSSDKFQAWLNETVTVLTTKVIPAIVAFVTILWNIGVVLANVIGFVIKHKEILGALAGILAVLVVPAFIAWAIAAGTAAVSTLIAFAPIILLGAIVGAVAMLIISHWKAILGGIGAAVNGIVAFIKKFGFTILLLMGPIGWLIIAIADMTEWVIAHWKQISTEVGKAINVVVGFINGLLNKVGGIKGIINTALSGLFGGLTKPFADAFSWIINAVGGVVNKLKDLNPFMKHSPSLVELVTAGTQEITHQYGNMYKNLGNMASGNGAQTHAATIVPQAGAGGGGGGGGGAMTVNIQNVHLDSKEATVEFFKQLGRNVELTGNGLAPTGY